TVMSMIANFVNGKAGSSTFYLSLAVMGVCSLLQSLSHGVEDVPPPLSNRKNQWAPVKEWVKETSIIKKLLLLVWGIFLEWLSVPRIFVVQLSLLLLYLRNRPAS